ncbi:hypothetical protein ACWD5R_21230 [Streptomyces sp. NPDC002514]|uniref:hypothetical protein n=1 Tax=Streptomyces sp. NPDC001270 TaxID=3364554 RepID=UPI0036AEE1B1
MVSDGRFDASGLYADWRIAAEKNFARLLESSRQRARDYNSENKSPDLRGLSEEAWQTYENYLMSLHAFVSAAGDVSINPQKDGGLEAFNGAFSAVDNALGEWMEVDKRFYQGHDAAARGAAEQSAVAETVTPQSGMPAKMVPDGRFDASDLYTDWGEAAEKNRERLLASNGRRDTDWQMAYENYRSTLPVFEFVAKRVRMYPQEKSRLEDFNEAFSAVRNALGKWMEVDKRFYGAAARGAVEQSAVAQTVAPQSERQSASQVQNRPPANQNSNSIVARALAGLNINSRVSRTSSSQPNGVPGQPHLRSKGPSQSGSNGRSR